MISNVAVRCTQRYKKFLVVILFSPPLTFESSPSLIDPKMKSEKNKLCRFYESPTLKHMRRKKYKLCHKLPPFDLYCPSVDIDDPEYSCRHSKKICTTKALLKLHLKATKHHSFVLEFNSDDESSTEEVDSDVEKLPDVDDGPYLIPSMEKFLESTWDITYK